MARKVNYVQCTMKRIVDAGVIWTTSYIPTRYAKVGQSLKLRNESSDEWVDGWTVESRGNDVIAHDALPNHRKRIRKHRQSTGDQFPRLHA